MIFTAKKCNYTINLTAKSFKFFCEKYKPAKAIRTAITDYKEESWMTNVPLYIIGDYQLEL
jgi:hypothetical protein